MSQIDREQSAAYQTRVIDERDLCLERKSSKMWHVVWVGRDEEAERGLDAWREKLILSVQELLGLGELGQTREFYQRVYLTQREGQA